VSDEGLREGVVEWQLYGAGGADNKEREEREKEERRGKGEKKKGRERKEEHERINCLLRSVSLSTYGKYELHSSTDVGTFLNNTRTYCLTPVSTR
jgi:hypothetical protein